MVSTKAHLEPGRSAPPMKRRVAGGWAIAFSVAASVLLVKGGIAISRGEEWWLYPALGVCFLIAAGGFALEWRRARRLAQD